MLEGTTPAPWVLQMVLPPGGAQVGATQHPVDQVREQNSLNPGPTQIP